MKSIIVDDTNHCYVCGKTHIQIHHCFYGTANRKKSDKYGLVIPLCMEHHLGNSGVHKNKELDMQLKKLAQQKFEELYGSREEFREEFGKSVL